MAEFPGPLVLSVLLIRVSGVGLLEKDINYRRLNHPDCVRRMNAFSMRTPCKQGAIRFVAKVSKKQHMTNSINKFVVFNKILYFYRPSVRTCVCPSGKVAAGSRVSILIRSPVFIEL
jgi:hypothetical protein